MKLLAIETATEACSAALYLNGEIRERYRVAPQEHSHLILAMLDELLADAGIGMGALDALAFGRGPGAFTGVRIAAGTIQGLAMAVGLPVVPVSTLAVLAQGAHRSEGAERVLAAIDARMSEVYFGAFALGAEGVMVPAGAEGVGAPETVPGLEGEGWVGAGSGWRSYGQVLRERFGRALAAVAGEQLPRARDVAMLAASGVANGQAVSAEKALPVYLRDKVVGK